MTRIGDNRRLIDPSGGALAGATASLRGAVREAPASTTSAALPPFEREPVSCSLRGGNSLNVIRGARNLLAVAVLALLALPASATADPVRDCARDGDLDKPYSNAELRRALDRIPGDLDEYSNCREVLSGAIAGGSDKGGNRPTAGAEGNPITPAEQAARDRDSAELAEITGNPDENPPSVEVGGERVEPGTNGLFDLASASNDLPMPLLVTLISLALVALTGGLVALRERIPALSRIPLLSKISLPRVSFPRFWR
jgi:hypothetical protein